MAILFQCGCGKSYSVPDEFATRRTKCKACGVVLTVPTAPVADDFEVVEEPPPPLARKPVKAAVIADDEPVRKRRKKAKAKYKGMTREEERELADGLNAVAARRGRVIRSVAFVVLGVVILLGDAVLFVFRKDFFALDEGMQGRFTLGMIAFAAMGLVGIGKGAWSLLTGQMED